MRLVGGRRLLFEALQLARATDADGDRAENMAQVTAGFAIAGMLKDALRLAHEIDRGTDRAWALASIAAHGPAELRDRAMEDALQVARTARPIEGGGNLSWALARVALQMPAGALREQVLDEALREAHSPGRRSVVNFAMRHLAPLLAKAGRLDDDPAHARPKTDLQPQFGSRRCANAPNL